MLRKELIATEDDWRSAAACRSSEAKPEWFGPVHSGSNSWADVEKALEFCRSCPVAARCYAEGRADRHAAGVYGGRYIRGRSSWSS